MFLNLHFGLEKKKMNEKRDSRGPTSETEDQIIRFIPPDTGKLQKHCLSRDKIRKSSGLLISILNLDPQTKNF